MTEAPTVSFSFEKVVKVNGMASSRLLKTSSSSLHPIEVSAKGFTPVHHGEIPLIHHRRLDTPNTTACPPIRPRHPLEYRLVIGLEFSERWSVFDFLLQQIETRARVLFGIMSAFSSRLNLTPTLFFCQPCQPGLKRPSARMVIDDRGVDAEGMADFESFEVRFEGVSE